MGTNVLTTIPPPQVSLQSLHCSHSPQVKVKELVVPSPVVEVFGEKESVLEEELESKLELEGLSSVDVTSNVEEEMADTNDEDDDTVDGVDEEDRVTPELVRRVDGVVVIVDS